MPKTIVYCGVPMCKSNTHLNPEKKFFALPEGLGARNAWLRACKRTKIPSPRSHVSICEDHFNLKEDLANYYEYMFRSVRARFKPCVVPRYFKCQEGSEMALKRARETDMTDTNDCTESSKMFKIGSEITSDDMGMESEIKFDVINIKQEHAYELSEMDSHLDNANQIDTSTDDAQTMDPEGSVTSHEEVVSHIKIECDPTAFDIDDNGVVESWPYSSEFNNQQMMTLSTLLTHGESNQQMSSTCKKCSSVCGSSELCEVCMTECETSYDTEIETSNLEDTSTNQALQMNPTTELVNNFECRICGDVYDDISRFMVHYRLCSVIPPVLHSSNANKNLSIQQSIFKPVSYWKLRKQNMESHVVNEKCIKLLVTYYFCPYCSSAFHTSDELLNHFMFKLENINNRKICEMHMIAAKCSCVYCPCCPRRRFHGIQAYNYHIKTNIVFQLQTFGSHVCETCKEDLRNGCALSRHYQKTKCKPSKEFKCVCCEVIFPSEITYKIHIHVGDLSKKHIVDTVSKKHLPNVIEDPSSKPTPNIPNILKRKLTNYSVEEVDEEEEEEEDSCSKAAPIVYDVVQRISTHRHFLEDNTPAPIVPNILQEIPAHHFLAEPYDKPTPSSSSFVEDSYYRPTRLVPKILTKVPKRTTEKNVCLLCNTEFVTKGSLTFHYKNCEKNQMRYLSSIFYFLKPHYGFKSMRYMFKQFNTPLNCVINAAIYFVCPYCFVLFDNEILFKLHISLKFTAPFENFTDSCKMMFNSKKLVCPLCCEKTDNMFSYNTHVRSHFSLDCYPCIHCKVGFNCICQLNNHHSRRCLHKEENQFASCYHCKATFPSKLSYLVHFERCKFVICPICNCKFSTAKALKAHEIKCHAATTTTTVTRKPRKSNICSSTLKKDELDESESTDNVKYIVMRKSHSLNVPTCDETSQNSLHSPTTIQKVEIQSEDQNLSNSSTPTEISENVEWSNEIEVMEVMKSNSTSIITNKQNSADSETVVIEVDLAQTNKQANKNFSKNPLSENKAETSETIVIEVQIDESKERGNQPKTIEQEQATSRSETAKIKVEQVINLPKCTEIKQEQCMNPSDIMQDKATRPPETTKKIQEQDADNELLVDNTENLKNELEIVNCVLIPKKLNSNLNESTKQKSLYDYLECKKCKNLKTCATLEMLKSTFNL